MRPKKLSFGNTALAVLSILLIFGLTGCGDSDNGTNPVGDYSISGTVTYEGGAETITVVAATAESGDEEVFSASVEINAPGNFTIPGLVDGIYAVYAFIDLDASGEPDFGEPYGAGGFVTIEGGDIDSVLIAINSGQCEINGTIAYDGNAQGNAILTVAGPSTWQEIYENPQFPIAFDIAGLADGFYALVAYIDVNGDGIVSVGDPVGGVSGDVVEGAPTWFDIEIMDEGDADCSISGRVDSFAFEQGEIIVSASGATFTPINTVEIDAPGNYEIDNIVPGSYFVWAFIDVNGDGLYTKDEPFGASEEVVELGPGEHAANIDILIL